MPSSAGSSEGGCGGLKKLKNESVGWDLRTSRVRFVSSYSTEEFYVNECEYYVKVE